MKLVRPRALGLALPLVLAGCGLQEHPRGPAASATPPPPPPPPPHPPPGIDPPRPPPPPPGVDAAAPPDPRPPDAGGAPPPDAPAPPTGGPGITDNGPPPPAAPAPAPGGPGITVNGRFVPRANAIVLLHIGHSNMAGRATNPPELRPFFYDPDPQLWVYAKGGAFRAAKEPTAPDNQMGQAAGPGMALLHTALAI